MFGVRELNVGLNGALGGLVRCGLSGPVFGRHKTHNAILGLIIVP